MVWARVRVDIFVSSGPLDSLIEGIQKFNILSRLCSLVDIYSIKNEIKHIFLLNSLPSSENCVNPDQLALFIIS